MSDLKAMGLYRNVDRVMADLQASGLGPDDPLSVADLTPFDQYHYEGTEAVDDAATALGVSPGFRLLDIGSGLGGPARYIADRWGASVTALELQPDLNETAEALTNRCGLSEVVTHLNGDILAGVVPAGSFDGIVSMLCFLHIENRAELFGHCARALVPDGQLFIDDYFALAPLTDVEQASLADKVLCPYVPDLKTYVSDLEAAGFVDVEATDKTSDWKAFVNDRFDAFSQRRPELVDRYDEATVNGLDEFYESVASIFSAGRLGGIRLTARRGQG